MAEPNIYGANFLNLDNLQKTPTVGGYGEGLQNFGAGMKGDFLTGSVGLSSESGPSPTTTTTSGKPLSTRDAQNTAQGAKDESNSMVKAMEAIQAMYTPHGGKPFEGSEEISVKRDIYGRPYTTFSTVPTEHRGLTGDPQGGMALRNPTWHGPHTYDEGSEYTRNMRAATERAAATELPKIREEQSIRNQKISDMGFDPKTRESRIWDMGVDPKTGESRIDIGSGIIESENIDYDPTEERNKILSEGSKTGYIRAAELPKAGTLRVMSSDYGKGYSSPTGSNVNALRKKLGL